MMMNTNFEAGEDSNSGDLQQQVMLLRDINLVVLLQQHLAESSISDSLNLQ